MEQKDTDVKVPLISKIAYGMGDVGCNFSWMFVGNFLMIFYTDVFGIGMGAVAGLMLFSRFWDAINDPVIGGLSDKTNTKWGRYRPWLLIAAPLTAIVLILTFGHIQIGLLRQRLFIWRLLTVFLSLDIHV